MHATHIIGWTASQFNDNSDNTFTAPEDGISITPIIDLLFEKWGPTRVEDMKELVPIIKTVYQWNILQKGKVSSVWTLDLKNGDGCIHRGVPKVGRADCILTIEDDNAVKIFEGKEDPMKAFMSGKLKIAGNIMAAQKLQQVWATEQDKVRSVLDDLKAGKPVSLKSKL
jgi:putative sterol carrier protein